MNLAKQLTSSEIFRGISSEGICNLLETINYQPKTYKKGEIIALEGEYASYADIVLNGEIAINKLYEDGKQIHIKKMATGNLIGFALVYSDHPSYANTLIAVSDVEIIRIPHEDMRKLCGQDPLFLRNFMRLISNQVVYLSERIKLINYGTIRKKIVNLILGLAGEEKCKTIDLGMTRQKMAETLGVSRPALSHEMIQMKKEGVIDYVNQTLDILDMERLEDMLK